MPETLQRSNLGGLQMGGRVNLERALQLDTRLGGHIVSGHIDGTGSIKEYRKDDNAVWITISAGPELLRYIIEKGSIAIDGVSLTVATVDSNRSRYPSFPIPERRRSCSKKLGDTVNLECDIIGKYVEKLLDLSPKTQTKQSNLSEAFLQENGFF